MELAPSPILPHSHMHPMQKSIFMKNLCGGWHGEWYKNKPSANAIYTLDHLPIASNLHIHEFELVAMSAFLHKF